MKPGRVGPFRFDRLRTRSANAAFACAAVTLLGCRPPAGAGAPAEATAPEALPVATARAAPEPLPAAKHALELLPAETLGFFEVAAPADLLRALGLPEVLTHGGVATAGAQMLLDEDTRAIVEDPEQLRRFGIDPSGSLGVAVLDVEAGAVAAWLTASDPALALRSIEGRAGRSLDFRPTRAGRIASLGRRDHLIVRDQVLVLVHMDDADAAPVDYPRLLADADPRVGLPSTPAFERAFGAPELLLARAYLSPDAVARGLRRRSARDRARSWGIPEMEAEVERMRNAGATPADISYLEDEIARMREELRRSEAREARAFELAESILGPVESVAVRMRAEGPRLDATVEARITDPEATLPRLFAALPSRSRWLATSKVAPLALLEGGFDAGRAYELMRLVAEADGEDWSTMEARFEQETGLSLPRDVVALLGGEFALGAYYASPPDLARTGAVGDAMDFALMLRVEDPSRAGALLDQLAKKAKGKNKPKRDAKTSSYRIEIDPGRSAYLGVAGQNLVLTTERDWFGRLRRGAVEAGASKLRLQGISAPFERAEMAGRGFMDLALPVFIEAREPRPLDMEGFDHRFDHYRELTPKQVAKIRWGKGSKRARARLTKAYARLAKLEREAWKVEFQQQLELVRRVGFTTFEGRVLPDRIEGNFGIRLDGGSLVGVILDVVDASQASREEDPELRELREEVRDLEYELEKARFLELDRWVEAHPKAVEAAPMEP